MNKDSEQIIVLRGMIVIALLSIISSLIIIWIFGK